MGCSVGGGADGGAFAETLATFCRFPSFVGFTFADGLASVAELLQLWECG